MSRKPIDEAALTTVRFLDGGVVQMDRADYDRLTAAQQQGQAVSFDFERARTLIDYVVGYARAAELKSLSSDACVALRDLHTMLHAPQPTQQGGGEVVAHGFYDPATGAYSETQRTPRWLPAVVCTAPPSAPVGVEEVVMAARNAENTIRNCAAAGQIGDGYVQYADALRDAVQRLAQQPAAVDDAMVDRAGQALYGTDWGSFEGWEADQLRRKVRAVLTAALAAQQQGGRDHE